VCLFEFGSGVLYDSVKTSHRTTNEIHTRTNELVMYSDERLWRLQENIYAILFIFISKESYIYLLIDMYIYILTYILGFS